VIVSDNENVDLAIVRLQQTFLPIGATYVPLKNIANEVPKLGEPVFTSGFPGDILNISDLDNKQVQVNSVRGEITKNDDTYSFVTTAPISIGASGSPVFNQYGQLVGVMNAQVAGKQSYNMGIYSSYLLELIEKAKITE
jgi:S1-C subfamily serine protease